MRSNVDRRVLRTRKSLRQCLVLLLRQKNYDDIRVQDIIDAANIGRSTFHAHCVNKEGLLRNSLRMLRSELAPDRSDCAMKQARPLAFSLKLLEHVIEHSDIYPALGRGRGREVLLRELRLVALELLREDLDAMALVRAMPRELAEQHIVGAFMSLLVWYLEQRPDYSPKQLDAMFQQLIFQGLPVSSLM